MANNTYSNSQTKPNCSGQEVRRVPNDQQVTSQIMDSANQSVANFFLPNSQGTTNPLLSYQSTSFSGLYSSSGFNSSLTGFENNLQWLSDNRMQSQTNQLPGNLTSDKNLNAGSTTHPLPPSTSHSCCVNRFGMLDSLGMSSPIPSEQVKPTCDVPNYQGKSNLTMSMIDPIQSWLNLPIPTQIPIQNNQQYCKFNERPAQNYNIPVSLPAQINLPLIDQTDLKQSDICVQSPDTCFEGVNSSSKHIEHNISNLKQSTFPMENKQVLSQENTAMIKQQGTFQPTLMSKDWKTTFQSMQNYISSPNIFGTVNEPQENFMFPQYTVTAANSYYPSDNYSNFVNKNNTCMPQTKTYQSRSENITAVHDSFLEENQTKMYRASNIQALNNVNNQYLLKQTKEGSKALSNVRNQGNTRAVNYNLPFTDCCQVKKSQEKTISIPLSDNMGFNLTDTAQGNKNSTSMGNQSSGPLETDKLKVKENFKNSEIVSSESDESNIIVEESDDIGEIESEISIEEIKKSYQTSESCVSEVLLRCLVCNTATSSQTPANQFVHINDSFPVTSSHTPVRSKLEQILPLDLQQYLKLHNSFMCRRCLNLVETVEVLEVKLTTAKRTISDNFSKTVQMLIPDVQQLLKDTSKCSKSASMEGQVVKPLVDVEMEVECQTDKLETLEENKVANTSDSDAIVEFQCPYCLKVLFSQKTLDLHLQTHTNEFNYYCERCGKGFAVKSTLEKHLSWHNGGGVQMICEICGEIYSSKHLFYVHQVKNHSGTFKFKCETCGKGFSRKVSLEIHSHKHTGSMPFMCEYCGRTFTSESNLKGHIKVCTKDMTYKCDVCGKSVATQTQLKRHKCQHNGVYDLTCSVCRKGFNKPSDLTFHMLSHSTEKQFKCSDCDKSFKTLGNLNYHCKSVHKEEIFRCTVCGKTFPRNVMLSDHMNSHKDEKPYTCAQCGENFVHQTTFFAHLKRHTGKVKMKTCPVCHKDISTRMSVHMRTHTKEKPYKCAYCPMAFTVSASLKKHVAIKHQKQKVLLSK